MTHHNILTNDPSYNADLTLRWRQLQRLMANGSAQAMIISTHVNLYYTTGAIFEGYLYLPIEGDPTLFVRRPSSIKHDKAIIIRKVEQIPELLAERGIAPAKEILLEMDEMSYNDVLRIQKAFAGSTFGNATAIIRYSRSLKSPWEIEQMRISGIKQSEAYAAIPELYEKGMTDIDLQIAFETYWRKMGSIGLFRGFGALDIFMGSLLVGDNAEAPSAYDFALGGAGVHPAAPIGANGTLIAEGTTTMVDMAGNYTAYISDQTRTFSLGKLPDLAFRAHDASIAIQRRLQEIAYPGIPCADLYNEGYRMVQAAELEPYFMGTKQQAKFFGHGIGLQINEIPIITPRSRETLELNIVMAVEPKFVIPGVGAVGTESSYVMTPEGFEQITLADEALIPLDK